MIQGGDPDGSEMRKSKSPPRRLVPSRGWKQIERVGILVALLVGIIGIAQVVRGCWGTKRQDNIRFIDNNTVRTLSADTVGKSLVFISGRIVVEQSVELPRGAFVATNELMIADGAKLTAKDLTIVATRLEGGQIDASGRPPKEPGATGDPGGNVFIAAARIRGTSIRADGGRGGDGSPGLAGSNGRDGKCDGFGGYRGADPGQPGQPGNRGGNGGDGGYITVLTSYPFTPQPSLRAGEPGKGGPGGSGGRGGAGCVGLGGTQPSQDPGPPGPTGADGLRGSEGTPDVRTDVPFDKVTDKFRRWFGGEASTTHESVTRLVQELKAIAP